MSLSSDLTPEVRNLLNDVVNEHNHLYGLGSMTCSIYDAAWVACVSKTVAGCTQYLFPSCFKYILDAQLPHGGWSNRSSNDNGAGVDEIISTLAALFALTELSSKPHQLQAYLRRESIADRISNGINYLSLYLPKWKIAHSKEVGFELLIPSLLDLLEERKIHIDFPGKEILYSLRQQKLSKVRPEAVYQNSPSAILHSLEAFYGDPNFSYDSVQHQKVNGSIMCSPSATAAYLMRCTAWDNEAEAYLRLVHQSGSGGGSGGVPNAYPSTCFELTWVFSILLHAGFSIEALGERQVDISYRTIQDCRQSNGGLVGFAPGVEADLDDSAKASVFFSLIRKPGFSKALVEAFDKSGHLKTYKSERDPSFTANCNGLLAILLDSNRSIEIPKIMEISKFLSGVWWKTDKMPEDKWNLSPFYSLLGLTQAFMKLLELWDQGLFTDFPKAFLRDEVLLTLFQGLIRTLNSQKRDGSWGYIGAREETAYSILILTQLRPLPLATPLAEEIISSIHRGRSFLRHRAHNRFAEHLWVGKTSYGSPNLSQAYILASLHIEPNQNSFGSRTKDLCTLESREMIQMGTFMSRLPLFSDTSQWLLHASWIESKLFLPRLKCLHDVVFKREKMSEDKYLTWIPLTWTASNNLRAHFLSSEFIFAMMTISLLNYQADEFMESVVDEELGVHLEAIKNVINELFTPYHTPSQSLYSVSTSKGRHQDSPIAPKVMNRDPPTDVPLSERFQGLSDLYDKPVSETQPNEIDVSKSVTAIQRFINFIMNYPTFACPGEFGLNRLSQELKTFLMAHITQIEDNREFIRQNRSSNYHSSKNEASRPLLYKTPRLPFRSWVRTVAADHTSCPYSFVFASLLRGSHSGNASLKHIYIAEDLCRSLATMCRMYNDYGSVQRDRKEWNLNSVNFLDLQEGSDPLYLEVETNDSAASNGNSCIGDGDAQAKACLYDLAEYERRRMQFAMDELKATAGKEMMDMVEVFVTVTDLFGQIYVVKDIASERLGAR